MKAATFKVVRKQAVEATEHLCCSGAYSVLNGSNLKGQGKMSSGSFWVLRNE